MVYRPVGKMMGCGLPAGWQDDGLWSAGRVADRWVVGCDPLAGWMKMGCGPQAGWQDDGYPLAWWSEMGCGPQAGWQDDGSPLAGWSEMGCGPLAGWQDDGLWSTGRVAEKWVVGH